MKPSKLFYAQSRMLWFITGGGVLILLAGFWFKGEFAGILWGIGIAQIVNGFFSLRQIERDSVLEVRNGVLRWKFPNMEESKIIDLRKYEKITLEWYGFRFSNSRREEAQFSTDGLWKADKKRLYKYLEAELARV